MKTLVMALMMASAGLVSAVAPALADHVCLDVRNIVSSKSTDGKTMVFKMKDGTTLCEPPAGLLSGPEV